jgi:hypothetical protein
LAGEDATLGILCPNVHVILKTKMKFAYHFIFSLSGLDLRSDKSWDLLDDIN